jgi:hypothetical protein
LDDGQIICKAKDLAPIQKVLDKHLCVCGATRGSKAAGDDIKSSVRTFGDPTLVASFVASVDDYISDTCVLSETTDPVKILGGWIGSRPQVTAKVLDVVRQTKELHAQIEVARDAATEFALNATCASIGKFVYSLRLVGDHIAEETLHDFDTFLRDSFGDTIGAVLEADAWEQAQCNLKQGGLGIHTAVDTRYPAVVGSMTGSRAAAFEWFGRIEQVGLAQKGVLQGVYDDRAGEVE